MRVRLTAAAGVVALLALATASATGAKTDAPASSITVWLMSDAQSNWPDAVTAATAAFKRQHPGVDVNVQYQAWGDYNAIRIIARTMQDIKSIEAPKIIEHWEKGAKFDVMKTREAYFRSGDHQMMHEMYTVTGLPPEKIRNQWDIFTASAPVPRADQPLETISSTPEENGCKFAA